MSPVQADIPYQIPSTGTIVSVDDDGVARYYMTRTSDKPLYFWVRGKMEYGDGYKDSALSDMQVYNED